MHDASSGRNTKRKAMLVAVGSFHGRVERGVQKKRKNEPIHVELKEKNSTKKKKKRMHNRLSGLSSAVGCSSSSRRRRRH